jgi:hypothetical protein
MASTHESGVVCAWLSAEFAHPAFVSTHFPPGASSSVHHALSCMVRGPQCHLSASGEVVCFEGTVRLDAVNAAHLDAFIEAVEILLVHGTVDETVGFPTFVPLAALWDAVLASRPMRWRLNYLLEERFRSPANTFYVRKLIAHRPHVYYNDTHLSALLQTRCSPLVATCLCAMRMLCSATKQAEEWIPRAPSIEVDGATWRACALVAGAPRKAVPVAYSTPSDAVDYYDDSDVHVMIRYPAGWRMRILALYMFTPHVAKGCNVGGSVVEALHTAIYKRHRP